MTDYNAGRRFIKARRASLVGVLPGRSKNIRGVFIHSTRGGSTDPNYDDGPGTEAWGNSASNTGAFWDGLIYRTGQQVKCTNWEQDEQPLWAAGWGEAGTWSAQENYIHLEFAQSTINQLFSEEELESGAQWCAELARTYKFPVERIQFLSQTGAAPGGFCDHQNSANGKKLGKTDPGPLFPWGAFLGRVRELVEPVKPVTLEEVVAALGGFDAIRAWNTKGNSLLAGYALEQAEQNQIQEAVEALKRQLAEHIATAHNNGKVPPHDHKLDIVVSQTRGVI